MKKAMTVKMLKEYLETMPEDSEVVVQTRYGKVLVGLIHEEEGDKKGKKLVVLNVVYDR